MLGGLERTIPPLVPVMCSPTQVLAGLPDPTPHAPHPRSRPHSASSPATVARKSAHLVSSSLLGVSPNTVEKAGGGAALRNLDPGPSLAPSLSTSIEHLSSPFSVLANVPLGWLAKIADDAAIVFRGEKGPAIE
ncbi:hypothetical protein D1007_04949 [Hordeum vulgare]|nr:hypothetical protein D1007_04949 [Hordeum vulgare]